MPKILAIDDVNDNLISLKALLKDILSDVDVITALTGPKGLELAATENPDVILLDIVMPGMDGFEVCCRLKEDPILREIPVVFLAALKESKENRYRALEIGAEAFLSKPIDETELIAQIRAMLKIRSANKQNRNEKERLSQLVSERTMKLEESQIETLKLLSDLKAEIKTRRKYEKERDQTLEQIEMISKLPSENPQPVLRVKEDGTILYANEASSELLQAWKCSIGSSLPIFLCHFIKEIYADALVKVININVDAKIISLVIAPISESGILNIYGLDITDQTKIKENLIASKKRFELSIKGAPIPMVLTDTNQDILIFNDKFTEMFGYSLKDITTAEQWWTTAYPDEKYRLEIQHSWELAISKAKNSGNSIEMIEGDLTIKDHSVRRVEFYMTLLEGFSVIVMIDITSRIQSEHEKAILLDQLNHRRKMDAIGELAGGMAHDFNNVLSGIMSASELLKLPTQGLNKKNIEYVDTIIQSSVRASDLISKLLAFSRKSKIITKALDIHEILNDTVVILESTIDKKITISLINDAINHKIVGDLSAIESAFLNIGINASHSMPEGGVLQLKTKDIFLDQTYCDSSLFEIISGDFIQIEITDTGCGIPQENLQKIFHPFFTTKALGKGTGLGLSAVYGTIQDHHGTIEVFSQVGLGTTFTILLPCSKQIIEKVHEISPRVTGSGTILVVDDEELNRTLNEDIFKSLGYNVLLAKDGVEAIDIFSHKHFEIDVVLMDMIMPKMNGSEAFYKMRKIDEDCKVIISSGYTHDESIDKLMRMGLAGFINKPYAISEISQLLNSVKQKQI